MKIQQIAPLKNDYLESIGFAWHSDIDGSRYVPGELVEVSSEERAHDRQQKAQRRAALAAEKVGVRGHFPGNGDDAERARAVVRDVRAEGAQAARRGSDVGRDAVALQRHGLRAERGADEQAVRLRFRGRDAHAARARPG